VVAAASRHLGLRSYRVVILADDPDVETDAVIAVDADRVAARALQLLGMPAVVVLDSDGRPLTAPATGTAAALATITSLAATLSVGG
jgi:hypothetical protein